ncbi:MAG: cyclic nucleotide-binding domain-containing protein [Anaerolineae bacterium]|nr:cyclic nucleotide-binding domain-containing protein [Anaerolineae bacterium]
MSSSDDLFGKILGGASSRPRKPDADGQTGLNPLDLLGLPAAQRDVINWLSRRKQARFDDIREALGLDTAQLTTILTALKAARHVQEALINGEIFYRVIFAGKVNRAARGLPESIWKRVDLDNTIFLREIPLFRGLADDRLRDIANQLEERRYRRNEVIMWQGGIGEGIYFIKSGIVGLTRLSPDRRETEILDYLKQGDLLGEYRLLFEQNITASATATALSEVELLIMNRDDVLALLKDHPLGAIELVQMLARRLLATDIHNKDRPTQAKLSLVFSIHAGDGGTMVGSALTAKIAEVSQQATVYTEYPAAEPLPPQFGYEVDAEVYTHPDGYNIFVPHGLATIPAEVRATLVMDRLMANYENIVIGITGPINQTVNYMLERATQVVVIVPAEPDSWAQCHALIKMLKIAIRPEKTSLFVIYNRAQKEYAQLPPLDATIIDFDLPWFEALSPLPQRQRANFPQPLAGMAAVLASRLGRTNQIGIYIPTRLPNQPEAAMQAQVQRTLDFLDQLFGSATGYPVANQAETDPAGVAGENIHLIETFVSKADMDRHLGSVLAFVEELKTELDQDAMALEVNQKVLLV